MLTETSVPGSDDWWVVELATQFGLDLPRVHKLKSYSDGTNALPDEADASMREAYRRFIHMSRLNMAELIVSARTNRMKPLGFRTAAPGDVTGDSAAWAMWKRNGLRVGVRDLFTDGGTYGESFLTTTGPSVPSPDARPLIVPSNPLSTVTRQYALQPWLAEGALQVGYDAINQAEVLTLFRPGYMRLLIREAKKSSVPSNGKKWSMGRGWGWASDPIPLGYTDEVPVFRLAGPDGMGMFEKHLDSLDRITNEIRERLTINAMQAFRQRAISGNLPDVYPEGHPLAGEKIDYDDIFRAGPAALWRLPADTEMWESSVTDTGSILNGSKEDIRNLAAASSTALYMLSPDAAGGSAEGASLAREALTFSTEEWIDRAEVPITLSLSTGFRAQADVARSDVGGIEVIWAPVDRSSILERSSAAASAKAGGLSQQMINEKIFQLTPAELLQEQQYKQDEAFATLATGA